MMTDVTEGMLWHTEYYLYSLKNALCGLTITLIDAAMCYVIT